MNKSFMEHSRNLDRIVEANMVNAERAETCFMIKYFFIPGGKGIRMDGLCHGIPCIVSVLSRTLMDARFRWFKEVSAIMMFGRANEFGDITSKFSFVDDGKWMNMAAVVDGLLGISNPYDLHKDHVWVNNHFHTMAFDWHKKRFYTVVDGKKVFGTIEADVTHANIGILNKN